MMRPGLKERLGDLQGKAASLHQKAPLRTGLAPVDMRDSPLEAAIYVTRAVGRGLRM
ncbi:MAG: hypothetical protein H6632_17535 [Anaerolineales bacterium]|nr:hypothetical protein [Anaerolineales bacterium]